MSDPYIDFRHIYETLGFEEINANGNLSELANIQRRIASQLHYAVNSNLR